MDPSGHIWYPSPPLLLSTDKSIALLAQWRSQHMTPLLPAHFASLGPGRLACVLTRET